MKILCYFKKNQVYTTEDFFFIPRIDSSLDVPKILTTQSENFINPSWYCNGAFQQDKFRSENLRVQLTPWNESRPLLCLVQKFYNLNLKFQVQIIVCCVYKRTCIGIHICFQKSLDISGSYLRFVRLHSSTLARVTILRAKVYYVIINILITA